MLVLLLVSAGAAQHKPAKNSDAAGSSLFPMTKGTTWTYQGHVKTENIDIHMRWTVTVVDAVDTPEISAALLRGGPWDLAWYQPNVQPGTHVVARLGNTYYLLHDDGRDTFADIKAGSVRDLQDRLSDDVWFRVPLHQGDSSCPPGALSQSPMYCWAVDSVAKSQDVKIGRVTIQGADAYQLVWRTNPDHQILTLVPGVGITSWEYAHQGSVAKTTLQLIEYRPGK